MVRATGTTTLGFALWTVAFTAVGWASGVVAKWYELKNRRSPNPLGQAVRESARAGEFLAIGVGAVVVVAYGLFVAGTIFEDHESLVRTNHVLAASKADLQRDLDVRKHTMVTTDPVFPNTIYLLQAFSGYRYAEAGRPCVIMLSAPISTNSMPSMIAQFSNSVSGCTTFGPVDASSDPDVETRARRGMVSDKIVFHAAHGNQGADRLFTNLSNLIQLTRSYELPSPAERSRLYRIPQQGEEDLIWLQFGPDVKWNEQLHTDVVPRPTEKNPDKL